jgi:hypothetical protein
VAFVLPPLLALPVLLLLPATLALLAVPTGALEPQPALIRLISVTRTSAASGRRFLLTFAPVLVS